MALHHSFLLYARIPSVPCPSGPRIRGVTVRNQTFEISITERYRRPELSIEEATVNKYLAGCSVRRVEDIPEAPWGNPGFIYADIL
jgi:hypothetical protein